MDCNWAQRLAPRHLAATFAQRKTTVPTERPIGLTKAFADDPAKQQLWKAFAKNIGTELPPLGEVIEELAAFLMPAAAASPPPLPKNDA